MRKIVIILLGCCLLFSFSAFAVTPKKWTFLIFINGNNNLDKFGAINIREMEQVGSDDQVNVVVQWASAAKHKALRLLVEKSKNPEKVTSPILEDLGQVDMGDYHSLQEFITWGIQHFPAEHYFVDVWNHGNGWHLSKMLSHSTLHRPHALGDISYDCFTGHSIKTEELGLVMKSTANLIGHKVDIYGSDACLMSMVEVANEMSDSVDYFVGSQDSEPVDGWPYGDFLKLWTGISDASPSQVSKILVDAYVKSYEQGSNDVCFSAFDLNKLAYFNASIAKLENNILQLSTADRKSILDIIKKTRSFSFEHDYGDVIDFINKLKAEKIQGLDLDNLLAVETAAQQLIIANGKTPTEGIANGLSMWLPAYDRELSKFIIRYHGLKFDESTHWGDALVFLHQK